MQELLSKWKLLGISDNHQEILWMSKGLPLAPLSHFQEGLNIIQNEADKVAHEVPLINNYMTYLRTKWMPLSDSVNSFYCTERTEPFEEMFFNTLIASFLQVL